MSDKKEPDAANKEKLQQQTNQMFNIAERTVMNYMANFLEEEPGAIFKDEIPTTSEPFILLPLEDYKKHVCLRFHMLALDSENKPIDPADQAVVDAAMPVSNLLKYEKVREGVGFLFYCAKNVYAALMHGSMVDNKPLTNTQLEFEQGGSVSQTQWAFQPRFYHTATLKIQFLEETLGRIMHIKQNHSDFPANVVKDANDEYKNVVDAIIQAKGELTAASQTEEKKINDDFMTRARLTVFITELHEDDLPKPITSADEDIGAQNASMPKISGSLYEDPGNAAALPDLEQDLKDMHI